MTKEELKKQAEDLVQPVNEMLVKIVEKFTASILEEMHDQLKVRDAEINKLRKAF